METATKLIEEEMERTEKTLTAVGKFGGLLVFVVVLSWIILLYKLSTLVSPLSHAETNLVFVCFALTIMLGITGITFMKIAAYKRAINTWREQSMKEYNARYKR